jgi:hypothetical protein
MDGLRLGHFTFHPEEDKGENTRMTSQKSHGRVEGVGKSKS